MGIAAQTTFFLHIFSLTCNSVKPSIKFDDSRSDLKIRDTEMSAVRHLFIFFVSVKKQIMIIGCQTKQQHHSKDASDPSIIMTT